MINMTYDPVLGVRYTFDKEQPVSQQATSTNNTNTSKTLKDIERMRVKQILRNNTKHK